MDNWHDFTQCQHSNFICCRECWKYLIHEFKHRKKKLLVPSELLLCITHLCCHIKKANCYSSRCSTDSRDHLTHSLTEISCAKHILYMEAQNQIINVYSAPGLQRCNTTYSMNRMYEFPTTQTNCSDKWKYFICIFIKLNRITPKHCPLLTNEMLSLFNNPEKNPHTI